MSRPLFVYNAAMSGSSVRCPNCAKRLSPHLRICPACGAEQPLHVRRIRCNYCGRRIPAQSPTCPRCEHNPRRFYLRPHHVLYPLGLVLLAVLIYFGVNAIPWVRTLAVGSAPTPTRTRAPTRTPALIVITATATDTPVLLAMGTDTPLPSATDTLAPVTPSTPTRTVTPTRRPTVRPQVLRPSPSATTVLIAAPVLESPVDGQSLYGPRKRITFNFHGMAPLREHDWFRIEVDFMDRTNQFANWCGWSQSNSIDLPNAYYDDSYQMNRTFRWHVNIAETATDSPSTCAAPTIHLSAPSPEWTFYWY